MSLFCFETFSYVSTSLQVSTYCPSCLSRLSRDTKENISFNKGFKIHKTDSEVLFLHSSLVLTFQSFVQYKWLLYQNTSTIMPHKTSRQIPCTDVYYSLLLLVSATLYCHLQGVTRLICYDKIYLTAIRLSPSGSSTVHIYTQTIHRTTQKVW